MELFERFMENVSPEPMSGCWLWTGSLSRGYGVLSFGGQRFKATRLSLELHSGKPMPRELDACHRCDNPPCVNPAHLWAGTKSENMKDAVNKGRLTPPHERGFVLPRKSHCARGHELTPDNIKPLWNGGRSCRECHRETQRRSDARRRADGRKTT